MAVMFTFQILVISSLIQFYGSSDKLCGQIVLHPAFVALSGFQDVNNSLVPVIEHREMVFINLFTTTSSPTITPAGHSMPLPCSSLHDFSNVLQWSRPGNTIPFRPRRSRSLARILVMLLLLCGDVEFNPGPPCTSSNIRFGYINICSAIRKAALIHTIIADHSLDVLALSETRLHLDMPNSILSDIAPVGYSVHHEFRSRTASHPDGGGLAVIHRNSLTVRSVQTGIQPTSFESQILRITSCKPPISIINAYRPPDRSIVSFCDEFPEVIANVSGANADRLLICGDLNSPGSDAVSIDDRLSDVFETLGLHQHVESPTRFDPDHILDLVITDQSSVAQDVHVIDSGLVSDHQLILATLAADDTGSSQRSSSFSYRLIKCIDPIDFEARIRQSSLYSHPAADAESFVDQLESVVTDILDEIAPLRTRNRRPPKAITRWLSDNAISAKRHRRKLERRYRETNSENDRLAYRQACRQTNKLINASRQDYFRSQLESAADCKKRWQIAKELLHSVNTVHERSVFELKQLCAKFSNFFVSKIVSLKQTIAATLASINSLPTPDPVYYGELLDIVNVVTVGEVRGLISSMPSKSSSVDFIPTSLLKLCPSVFSELITYLANLSFSEGIFPTKFKVAAVIPLLKKPSLDQDIPSNYRPISNLNNISKVVERLFLTRLFPHVTLSPHFNNFQSAYRSFHSTETALLHTFDHIYRSADSSQPTLLVSLDLSAAFDTIDHSILLSRLSTSFGVNGTALAWLSSYLLNRSQIIRIGSTSSSPSICQSGVPQGSVLGPILFSLYISPIGQLISDSGISHQQYADDAQLYIALKTTNIITAIDRLETCLCSLRNWLCFNGLCLNPDKSESILFGTHQRLSHFPNITSIKVADAEIQMTDKITSLGVTLDSTLNFNQHTKNICKSCHFHLRSLRHIRRSLTQDMAISISVALVQSRLDYCNSLLFNISSLNLCRLQRVQNRAARLALNEWHSPTELLFSKLHWLPIRSRINFKISTLTFKLLHDNQPAYLRSLINPHAPSRQTRSSDKCFLDQPRTKTSIGQRAFSVCAPRIWNSIPLSIRLSPSLTSFKQHLKTHYFLTS